jgi:hypothetical protein
MKKIVLIAMVVLLLLAAAWRWVYILPYPLGGGQYQASPDGKFEAHASNLTDKTFWGGERHYYEFSVYPQGRSSEDIRTVRMDHLPGVPPFPMRGDRKIILWSPDSTSVTFAFQDIELKLNLEPPPEGNVP